jgi:O-antigen/teichoic acid export membrane protein
MDDGELGTVMRGAGLALVIRVLAGVVGYITAVLLARWMGPSEYGYYIFATTAMTLLVYPTTLGLPGAAVRFAAQYRAAKDWPHLIGLLRTSAFLAFGCGAAVAAAGISAVLYFKTDVNAGYVGPIVMAFVGLPVVALSIVRSEAIRGLGWLGLAWGPPQLGQPLLLLLVAVAMMFIVLRLSASIVVGASILAYLAMLIAQSRALRARLGTKSSIAPKVNVRQWLGVALSFIWISIAGIAFAQTGIILVGIFLTPIDVAIYSAATATSELVTFPLQATNAIGAPKIAALHAEERYDDLQSLVNDVIRWTFWPSLAIVVIFIAFGSLILRMFGPGFERGHSVLLILALGQLVNAFTGPVGNLLNMTGHQADTARVLGSCALVGTMLGLVLTRLWGTEGTAIAFSGGTMLWNAWLWVLVVHKLKIHPSLFRK